LQPVASCAPLHSRNLSSDVSTADEPHVENGIGGARASHHAGETTDVRTKMVYREFLKSETGEYLTRRGKVWPLGSRVWKP
jgi:hypothetical protein